MENIWRENLSQIEIKSLNAYYDKLHVLKDINLNVEKGEILSLIGPSGSGKSSLLKMLVGLLKPKSDSNCRYSIVTQHLQYNIFIHLRVTCGFGNTLLKNML